MIMSWIQKIGLLKMNLSDIILSLNLSGTIMNRIKPIWIAKITNQILTDDPTVKIWHQSAGNFLMFSFKIF